MLGPLRDTAIRRLWEKSTARSVRTGGPIMGRAAGRVSRRRDRRGRRRGRRRPPRPPWSSPRSSSASWPGPGPAPVFVTAAVVGVVVVPVAISAVPSSSGPTTTPSSTSSSTRWPRRGTAPARAPPSSISRLTCTRSVPPAEVDLDLAAGRLLDLDRPACGRLGLQQAEPGALPLGHGDRAGAAPSATRVAPVAGLEEMLVGMVASVVLVVPSSLPSEDGPDSAGAGPRPDTRARPSRPPARSAPRAMWGTGELHGGSFASVGCRTPPRSGP